MTAALIVLGSAICVISLFAIAFPKRLSRAARSITITTPLRLSAFVIRVLLGILEVSSCMLSSDARRRSPVANMEDAKVKLQRISSVLCWLLLLPAWAPAGEAASRDPVLGLWQGTAGRQKITIYLCEHGKCFGIEGGKENVGEWSQEGGSIILVFEEKTLVAGLVSRAELLVTQDEPRRAALLARADRELPPAIHYRHCHEAESLYAAIHDTLRAGDTMAKVETLLGPGLVPENRAEFLTQMRRTAADTPARYPDGIADGDAFLGYARGPSTLYLQFRHGKLINFSHDEFRAVPEL